MKAPFPWFGGKSRVAHAVWDRFGNVPNYVEPFAGSLAVLLARPGGSGRNETVNDKDCYLANFWRALQHDPEQVAYWADAPVNEADLHARHRWLIDRPDFRERMMTDPAYFVPQIAGWWVWGLSLWIGDGWCVHPEWQGRHSCERNPRGVHALEQKKAAAQTRWCGNSPGRLCRQSMATSTRFEGAECNAATTSDWLFHCLRRKFHLSAVRPLTLLRSIGRSSASRTRLLWRLATRTRSIANDSYRLDWDISRPAVCDRRSGHRVCP